jgi:hypothetical protein
MHLLYQSHLQTLTTHTLQGVVAIGDISLIPKQNKASKGSDNASKLNETQWIFVIRSKQPVKSSNLKLVDLILLGNRMKK